MRQLDKAQPDISFEKVERPHLVLKEHVQKHRLKVVFNRRSLEQTERGLGASE